MDDYIVIPSEKSPICTPDGYYATLQHNNEFNKCVDIEGNVIEHFENIETNSIQGRSMNCACAQTRKYLSELKHKPKCCVNGNFEGMQCQSGFCFCVNEFGVQEGIEVEQSQVDQLNCPDFCCEDNSYLPDTFCNKFQ